VARRPAGKGPSPARQPKVTHPIRVVVYVRTANKSKIVMDASGDGYHAAVGYFEGNELVAQHSVGGGLEVMEMLAEIIGDRPTG
jgi:hypothetical protein